MFNTLKKIPSDRKKVTKKMHSFFLQLTSFAFNSQFLHELKDKVRLSKSVWGIFHFRFRLVFIKVCFCSTESMVSLTLSKCHNSFQD